MMAVEKADDDRRLTQRRTGCRSQLVCSITARRCAGPEDAADGRHAWPAQLWAAAQAGTESRKRQNPDLVAELFILELPRKNSRLRLPACPLQGQCHLLII